MLNQMHLCSVIGFVLEWCDMGQVTVLAGRLARNTWRHPLLVGLNWVATLAVALGLGAVYWQVDRETGGIQNRWQPSLISLHTSGSSAILPLLACRSTIRVFICNSVEHVQRSAHDDPFRCCGCVFPLARVSTMYLFELHLLRVACCWATWSILLGG